MTSQTHGSRGFSESHRIFAALVRRAGCRSKRRWRAASAGFALALAAAVAVPAPLPAQTLSTNSGLADVQLSSAYEYQPVSVAPSVTAPVLPLDLSQVSNASSITQRLSMSQSACNALVTNGFVVVSRGQAASMAGVYSDLFWMGIPTFVTSDSMLHLYHVQFDSILRTVETNQFLPQLKTMSQAMLAGALNDYASLTGDLQEAGRRNMAFFCVALKLLGVQVTVPDPVAGIVAGELANIQAQAGFAQSPLFNYQQDYSQFTPRGHYTASEDLQRYFQAMMWYGQMTHLLKGGDVPGDALVSVAEARIQTLAALLMALELDQSPACAATWNQIYAVTAFFVGLADDLTPYQYKLALMQVFGAQVNVLSLTDDATFLALRKALAAMPSPEIYGGTGNCSVPPNATAADLDAVLDQTKGMRLMGQRFIPDSYMMQHLVFPSVGAYTGTGSPFTLVVVPPPIRAFPRGLDVMAVLGSERALGLLDSAGDTDYVDYDLRANDLLGIFDAFGQAEWTRNLYWGWLYTLRPLFDPCGPGYPPFMQTTAWHDKQLNAALASWTELRHDTILYAKQSTTIVISAAPSPPNPSGYVEPVPEVFERLRALTALSRNGLANLNVLDATQTTNLLQLESILARLRAIAVTELQGQPLSDSDNDFIGGFYNSLPEIDGTTDDPQEGDTTLVADVHTDPNSGQVLEEGDGYVKVLVAACALPQEGTFLAAGPSFSYYEFKEPMSGRLTDQAWTNLLAGASAPARPDWTGSFMDPVTLFPDAGVSPANAARLSRSQLGADGFHLRWLGAPAARYRALYSDDLVNWFLLRTPVGTPQGAGELVDTNAAAANHRFYKVKLVP